MAYIASNVLSLYTQVKIWFISIVHVISTCTATKILYVLPDNVSDVNCPSQPCATLGQYLLDNGSLPVLSNVEYYFLPGEHHVINVIKMEVLNLSLIGFGLAPPKLILWSQSYVGLYFSYNVTIRNLAFSQYSGDVISEFSLDIDASLFIYDCSHCKVENIWFYGYGFAGLNMFLNSSINNITIDLSVVMPTIKTCSPKFLLAFRDIKSGQHNDSIFINNIYISGFNKICYEHHEAMDIFLYQKHYNINVELYNSQFHNMDQTALNIHMIFVNASGSLLIKNCSFRYIKHAAKVLNGLVANNNAAIQFENCAFYNNTASSIINIDFEANDDLCIIPNIIMFTNCNFSDNYGTVLNSPTQLDCKPKIFFHENVTVARNEGDDIMHFSHLSVYMNGTITIFENIAAHRIIVFDICNVTFSKTITFISNKCINTVLIKSHELPYILITDHTNIRFINNTIDDEAIAYEITGYQYYSAFPYCIFQYMISMDYKFNMAELIAYYIISFIGNESDKEIFSGLLDVQMNNIYNLLTHCQWLPTAVFNDSNPEYINQQIVQVDGHPWVHHKRICYCPHDDDVNCTVNLLGPVYPGQVLQVDLCMPQADKDYIITVETHAVNLPNSACKLAHQNEFINYIGNNSKTFNFTIISEVYEICELFLTSLQFIRTAFYIQLSQCPVGFTLQNGKCDCDPFLPPDIDTCYIDLSAITRPANTWITAHTLTNNTTNYLISDCPMDYCLPYSTNVNLLYPDLQCQFNRTGTLCSQCQHPLSMVFASSRCMKCTNVHILITIIVIVAGIVLVMLLYVLNLTVTKGTINGIIFYANIVSINDSVFLVNDNVFKPLRVFISFTNLDLGIETCFYDGMDSYAKMWLQLFFPSYLIIIAVSIIIASRYSSRILRLTYSRSLPVLATLFLLSYTGVLRVVLTVLFSYSTITEYPSGDKEIVWSIDSSVPLFGLKFAVLFITCLVLLLILFPFSIILLFRRYLARFRMINYFKPLLDAFQGSYKDKYYYWIAVQVLLRSKFFLLYIFSIKLRLFLGTIILVLFSICYGYIRPNKNKLINIQELSLLVNLTIMHIVSVLNSENVFSVVINLMICCAFVQFCIIILCHLLTYTFHYNVTIKKSLVKLWNRKKPSGSYDVALLNIPERTYNYAQYQDGLVSDDFK